MELNSDNCKTCGHSFLDHYDCYELETEPFCEIKDCDCEYMIWDVKTG